jgi:hypothetical protein
MMVCEQPNQEMYNRSNKVAVTVVVNEDDKLCAMVHNFAANLPIEWKIQVFHPYTAAAVLNEECAPLPTLPVSYAA